MEGRRGGLGRARAVLAIGLAALVACAVMASSLRVSALAQNAPSGELGLATAAFDAGDFTAAVITSIKRWRKIPTISILGFI